MARKILNRIANFLFFEWCALFEIPELKKHYEELLEMAHAALDQMKPELEK